MRTNGTLALFALFALGLSHGVAAQCLTGSVIPNFGEVERMLQRLSYLWYSRNLILSVRSFEVFEGLTCCDSLTGAACPAQSEWTPSLCNGFRGCGDRQSDGQYEACDTVEKMQSYFLSEVSRSRMNETAACKAVFTDGDDEEGKFGRAGMESVCKTNSDVVKVKSSADFCGWACAYMAAKTEAGYSCSGTTDCSAPMFGLGEKIVQCSSMREMMTAVCDMTSAEMEAVIDEMKGNGCDDNGVTFKPATTTGSAMTPAPTTTPTPVTTGSTGAAPRRASAMALMFAAAAVGMAVISAA